MLAGRGGLESQLLGIPRAHRHGVEQADRGGDLVVAPSAAVLIGQRHQLAGIHAGLAPGVLEQQQRQQRLRLRRGRHQPVQQLGEPDGLARDVGAQQLGARRPARSRP